MWNMTKNQDVKKKITVMKKRIKTLLEEIEGRIQRYCEENCEMPGTFEYDGRTDNNWVTVKLVHNGDGWYEVEDADIASMDGISRTCIEDALVGCTLDMTQTAEDVEDMIEDRRRYHRNTYDYNGVSPWDFL